MLTNSSRSGEGDRFTGVLFVGELGMGVVCLGEGEWVFGGGEELPEKPVLYDQM